jgi:hypothetical protein
VRHLSIQYALARVREIKKVRAAGTPTRVPAARTLPIRVAGRLAYSVGVADGAGMLGMRRYSVCGTPLW